MIYDHPESPASKMEYLQRIFHHGIRRSGTVERVSVVTKFPGVGAGKLVGNEKLEVKGKVQKLVGEAQAKFGDLKQDRKDSKKGT